MKLTPKIKAALPTVIELSREGAPARTQKEKAALAGVSPMLYARILHNLGKLLMQDMGAA